MVPALRPRRHLSHSRTEAPSSSSTPNPELPKAHRCVSTPDLKLAVVALSHSRLEARRRHLPLQTPKPRRCRSRFPDNLINTSSLWIWNARRNQRQQAGSSDSMLGYNTRKLNRVTKRTMEDGGKEIRTSKAVNRQILNDAMDLKLNVL
ncbi:hypothetical protein PIB30_027606 [Stylosanthes scabra]|uniref:Uncharacterized protein n=1 Tax=Stylosanthes scabra TaxID=79078 RepID=A0ABU6Y966_9FABA|nr:hypothetical protein [Stylosanthes scabra]